MLYSLLLFLQWQIFDLQEPPVFAEQTQLESRLPSSSVKKKKLKQNVYPQKRAKISRPKMSKPKSLPADLSKKIPKNNQANQQTEPMVAPKTAVPAEKSVGKNLPVIDLSVVNQPTSNHSENQAKAKKTSNMVLDLGEIKNTSDHPIVFDFQNTDKSSELLMGKKIAPHLKESFSVALRLMAEERFEEAALVFDGFLNKEEYKIYHEEAQYQLAKALFRLGFVEGSLIHLKNILSQGTRHSRFQKSVEALFLAHRKIADKKPILAYLAQFKDVNFPKAYRNEYYYLMTKYYYMKAFNIEVNAIQEADLQKAKNAQENQIDFGAVAQSLTNDGKKGLDFSQMSAMVSSSDPIDFSSGGTTASQVNAATTSLTKTEDGSTMKDLINRSLSFSEKVSKISSYYPRTQYLIGLLYYLDKEDQKAVDSFLNLVRLLGPANPKDTSGVLRFEDIGLRELAFLSLARIHYEHEQFDKSIYYYDQIDKDSDVWLVSLFESAWAYYRRGDFSKSLGQLLTLQAPFFKDSYFPESEIIASVVYFEGCRYLEARQITDDFIKKYTVVMEKMTEIALSQQTPDEIEKQISSWVKTDSSQQSQSIRSLLSLVLNHEEILQSKNSLEQIISEEKLLKSKSNKFLTSNLSKQLSKGLNDLEVVASGNMGEMIQKVFERESYQLKSLLSQALRIKIEVTRMEREMLSENKKVVLDKLKPQKDFLAAITDERYEEWPYDGEYWRDELGSYILNFSSCSAAIDGAALSSDATAREVSP